MENRLKVLADTYETADFLIGDPSWFMHQVSGAYNQECMAFLAAALSYGSRKQFLPKIQYFLDCSRGETDAWVREGRFIKDIPDDGHCYYRLYTNHNMHIFLSAYRNLLLEYGSLGQYVIKHVKDDCSLNPKNSDVIMTCLEAVKSITEYFQPYETGIIPKNTDSSCKRLCMFLRWMVRDNSPVDLGLWRFIDKKTLIIPLDTHVLQEAANLGLVNCRSASMRTAVQLTERLSVFFPDDPVRGDFALFGLGVNRQ